MPLPNINETTKVAAGTWQPLCEQCAAEMAREHNPFTADRYVGRSDEQP